MNKNRKYIRYRRNDLHVCICRPWKRFIPVRVFNISQDGLSLGSSLNLKLNAKIRVRVSFDKDCIYEQKCTVVRKMKKLTGVKRESRKWLGWVADYSVYRYGLAFDEVVSELQHTLLQSNIAKRLEHYKQ